MTGHDHKFQIEFLRQMQGLLADGGFVATYKYALLHAIADLCVECDPADDGSLTLTVEQLAAKFVDLYWRQAQTFPVQKVPGEVILRQNTGKQAAVITTLCELQSAYDCRLPTVKRDPAIWRKTLRSISRTIKVMPLWKLQTIGSRSVEFMYRNNPGADRIVLHPGIPRCFRDFHGLVIELVRAGWVRFIRRQNDSVRENLELYTFLFGTERASMRAYLGVLADVDGSRCFYCEKAIRGAAQVDHFVPWARYPNDLGHNLVLAHGGCNGKKSDHLAAEEHLRRWLERNRGRGGALADGFQASGLAHDCDTSIRIARWAYSQLEATQGDVWVRDRDFRPLKPEWRDEFEACAT